MGRGVGNEPMCEAGAIADAAPGGVQCRRGQVKHGDVLKPPFNQMIDQTQNAPPPMSMIPDSRRMRRSPRSTPAMRQGFAETS